MALRNAKNGSKAHQRNQLQVQELEARQMMTGNLVGDLLGFGGTDFRITESHGVVEIDGTRFADSAEVSYMTMGTESTVDDRLKITIENDAKGTAYFPRIYDDAGNVKIRQIIFRGWGGDDRFENETGVRTRAYGGAGNDNLIGGSNVDYLFGDSGDDRLIGNDGEDRLFGGTGDDLMSGGDEDDRLRGDAGNDRLFGGNGDDTLHGNGDDDYLSGGNGDDHLDGGTENDFIYGGRGDDFMSGYTGNDRLLGGSGNDLMLGGDGADTLYGHAGNDTLLAGRGNDRAYGGSGNDALDGNDGDDFLDGGAHADLVFGGDGFDFVYGGDGDDIVGGGYLDLASDGTVSIGNQRDYNADKLQGGRGEDVLIIQSRFIPGTYWADRYVEDSEDTVVSDGLIFDTGVYVDTELFGHLYVGANH